MVIRKRISADDAAIRRLNDAAFGSANESRLIEDLRAAGLAAIELVTAQDAAIVGHILFSVLAVVVGSRQVRTLALAPMSVLPGFQRRGIGGDLIRAGLTQAREFGWQAVIVLGHRDYYPRFGFSADLARLLKAPFSGDAFMALELVRDALRGGDGSVVYPPAFGIAS